MFDFLLKADLPWVYYTLTAAYALTIVGIIVVVLSENRSPVKSLAWVTVLLLLPAVGIVLYLFFGRSIKNTRMISRRNRRRLRRHEEQGKKMRVNRLDVSDESRHLIKLTRSLQGSLPYSGNDVRVFSSGRDKIDSLLADIDEAREFINMQYYIIDDDETGTRLKDTLVHKAKQGITVRIIYDHVGSYRTRKSFFRELTESGVQAYPFFKVVFPPFGTRINWRNHRKICIIDGKVGYIGGMNIADRYITGGKTFASWRDTHIRIFGPAVASLEFSFAVDWNFMGLPLIEDHMPAASEFGQLPDNNIMQLLTSGPTSQWTSIALLFTRAIASAKKRVYIQTPYFLPTEGLLRTLISAALTGVDVRIMLPVKSDSRLLTSASASYITECLKSGMKIYFYNGGMLHAKTMIVDDEFVSIGSTNFDFRSFEHNFEANMQVYSEKFNTLMTEIFISDLEKCDRVVQSEWRRRPLLKKGEESLMRLFSPIL